MRASIHRWETAITIGVSTSHYFNSPFANQNQKGTSNPEGNDAQRLLIYDMHFSFVYDIMPWAFIL